MVLIVRTIFVKTDNVHHLKTGALLDAAIKLVHNINAEMDSTDLPEYYDHYVDDLKQFGKTLEFYSKV